MAAVSRWAAETTAQAVPLGYPNAPGLWRGGAPRGGRALAQRKTRAVLGVEPARTPGQTILKTVQEPHLLAKGQQAKRQGWTRWRTAVGQWGVPTRRLVQGLGARRARVPPNARRTLQTMHEVAQRLVPQMGQWSTTGGVAQGQSVPAGVTQARALGRHQAGQAVEGGLP